MNFLTDRTGTRLFSPFLTKAPFTSLEFCAGAGGQALGFERAGFQHIGLVDNDADACSTLRLNRPDWPILEGNMRQFNARKYANRVDVVAGGLPCPPFTIAGLQRGRFDERDLFPSMIEKIGLIEPRAVVIENVEGFLSNRFKRYREKIFGDLRQLGFAVSSRVIDTSHFGVSQRRRRTIIVALRPEVMAHFRWPDAVANQPGNVGDLLYDLMAAEGWEKVDRWRAKANGLAPTIVGGSKKHGGADLGPTRTRAAWAALGVQGTSLADAAPAPEFQGMPRLTLPMVARLQGFPDAWVFSGKKTSRYRQIGNALPPAVAWAIGRSVKEALFLADHEAAISQYANNFNKKHL